MMSVKGATIELWKHLGDLLSTLTLLWYLATSPVHPYLDSWTLSARLPFLNFK